MLTKSTIPTSRIDVNHFTSGATIAIAPTLVSKESLPLRDMIAKTLEDANLFYVASYIAPTDTTKIWLDLNGTNPTESTNVAGVYKVLKNSAWTAMTLADLPKVISAHTLIDGITITRDVNGALVAGAGAPNGLPKGVTIVNGVIKGLDKTKKYRIHAMGDNNKTLGMRSDASNLSYFYGTYPSLFATVTSPQHGATARDTFIVDLFLNGTEPSIGAASGVWGVYYTDSPYEMALTNAKSTNAGALTQPVYEFGLYTAQQQPLDGFPEIYSITELTPL